MNTKSSVVLFAGNLQNEALEPYFDGKSAYQRAVEWAIGLNDITQVVVYASKKMSLPDISSASVPLIMCAEETWTVAALLKQLSCLDSTVIFAYADCPFYSNEITASVRSKHETYRAEYTFADGYPIGLAPEIIDSGTLSILSSLCATHVQRVRRDSIFSVLKTDINAFEIETEIAPIDLRYLRLTLACDSKRNAMQCMKIFSHPLFAKQNGVIDKALIESVDILRTLPAFYSIHIAGPCPGECSFCPYPSMCRESRGVAATNRNEYMSFEKFSSIIENIVSFSGDAVVGLSAWGEPLLHPQLDLFVQKILSYPSLSVLIETTGIGNEMTEKMLCTIARIVSARATDVRHTSEYPAIHWIVSTDAINEESYKELHGNVQLNTALTTIDTLLQLFPQMVWIQFLRLQENEDVMEKFWRAWKEKTANVIIQKYDDFCSALPDKKVADLRPIYRNPCWHLRRDMTILIDGSVPICHEDIRMKHILGNVFTESLESIWSKGNSLFQKHLENKYEGMCKNCDEYYTYNF